MTLQLTHNSGFFSCCSVACYDIIDYIKQHKSVPEVDFSNIFRWYRSYTNQNVYNECFKFNELQELNIDEISKIDYIRHSKFNYEKEDFKRIKPIVQKWFDLPDSVLEHVEFFIKKYEIDMDKTLAICFRGTDKFRDVDETSYENFISHAPSILKIEGLNRVFIQTDQTQFIDFFKNSFPDISFFTIEEILTTKSKIHLYRSEIKKENKVVQAQMFLASMRILSKCKFLINHTGNTARWITKYRGSAHNTIQYQADKLYSNLNSHKLKKIVK